MKTQKVKEGDTVEIIEIHPKDAFYNDEDYKPGTIGVVTEVGDREYFKGFASHDIKVGKWGDASFLAVKVKKVKP